MTIVVANYRYVNWIHEARFTWKRILQDALWDDGIRFPSLPAWTNPCLILIFMEYNPNVILLTACSHYVINYLHKFSYPPENGFLTWFTWKQAGSTPVSFSTCSIHDASLPCSPSGACGKQSCVIMEPAWCSAYSACMSDYMVEMRHENGHADGGDLFFWNTMIWQRVYSLFCFRESPVRLILF